MKISKVHHFQFWQDLSFKLANNSKLTRNEYKKCFENNLYLYYNVGDYKLNSCPKKQAMVTLKNHSTLTATDSSVAFSEKPLEK